MNTKAANHSTQVTVAFILVAIVFMTVTACYLINPVMTRCALELGVKLWCFIGQVLLTRF